MAWKGPGDSCGGLSLSANLPWAQWRVVLQLWVRKFFCVNGRCPRRIFTERLSGVVASEARRPLRFAAQLTARVVRPLRRSTTLSGIRECFCPTALRADPVPPPCAPTTGQQQAAQRQTHRQTSDVAGDSTARRLRELCHRGRAPGPASHVWAMPEPDLTPRLVNTKSGQEPACGFACSDGGSEAPLIGNDGGLKINVVASPSDCVCGPLHVTHWIEGTHLCSSHHCAWRLPWWEGPRANRGVSHPSAGPWGSGGRRRAPPRRGPGAEAPRPDRHRPSWRHWDS